MSTALHINIISFTIPFPPNYGGAIDVFYKIKELHDAGVKVHLHCFGKDIVKYPDLEILCEEIFYYKRIPMRNGILDDKPFIVISRSSPEVKKNLLKNDYPILFEGLHTTYFLPDNCFQNRLKIVRMHNDEAEYYLSLGKREKKFFQKLYYFIEHRRLLRYEKVLQYADAILCIAHHETEVYQKKFKNVSYLSAFHGNDIVLSKPGKGNFILYHGNLGVNENEEAALYLLNQIFSKSEHAFVIAGRAPSQQLISVCSKMKNVKLVADLHRDELRQLMQDAHIHVLPAFQDTGVKLKLLQALFNGRFILTNSVMVKNTGLEKYCSVADTPEQMLKIIDQLMQKEFTAEDILFRKNIEAEYSGKKEAEKIITLLKQDLPS